MGMSITARPFYFLRHGQTDWNVEGRMQGHTDIPLNATGLQQAHAAAQRMAQLPVTRIVSSPLVRALKTAAITAETLKLPIHIDSALKERTFGSFEGRTSHQIKAAHGLNPEDSLTKILPADAEQWDTTLHRARTSINHWLETYPEDTILFVGHGAFFRALHETLLNERYEAANATPYLYTPTLEGWSFTQVV